MHWANMQAIMANKKAIELMQMMFLQFPSSYQRRKSESSNKVSNLVVYKNKNKSKNAMNFKKLLDFS